MTQTACYSGCGSLYAHADAGMPKQSVITDFTLGRPASLLLVDVTEYIPYDTKGKHSPTPQSVKDVHSHPPFYLINKKRAWPEHDPGTA